MSSPETTEDARLTAQSVKSRLCALLWEVHEALGSDEACDCFCGKNGLRGLMDDQYRNDGVALAWIEATVRGALKKSATHE
jgi:hypothetical protein